MRSFTIVTSEQCVFFLLLLLFYERSLVSIMKRADNFVCRLSSLSLLLLCISLFFLLFTENASYLFYLFLFVYCSLVVAAVFALIVWLSSSLVSTSDVCTRVYWVLCSEKGDRWSLALSSPYNLLEKNFSIDTHTSSSMSETIRKHGKKSQNCRRNGKKWKTDVYRRSIIEMFVRIYAPQHYMAWIQRIHIFCIFHFIFFQCRGVLLNFSMAMIVQYSTVWWAHFT